MKKLLLFFVVMLAACGIVYAGHGDTGCQPCHVAHADPCAVGTSDEGPLWNRDFTYTSETFDMYGEGGLPAALTGIVDAEPTGTTKMCLSCHDGETNTSGINSVAHNSTYDIASGDTGSNQSLRGSHPVSVTYDESVTHLKATPTTLVANNGDKVNCDTCHSMHGNNNNLLRIANGAGALCKDCHNN